MKRKRSTSTLSPCQDCRYAGAASTAACVQSSSETTAAVYLCSKGHRWAECWLHDFKIRRITNSVSLIPISYRCCCGPAEPLDDGESEWVEVKATVRGYYGERHWEEIVPRSLLELYEVLNPTFYFNSLDGKHADVDKKYRQLEIDVESAVDEDLDEWLESTCHDHLGAELDDEDVYGKDYVRFRQFHARWTPESDAKALAKECGFIY